MTETTTAYRELFRCFVPNLPGEDPDDHEHARELDCDWGFICNQDGCSVRVDGSPCPEHAPMQSPGLRLVECHSEPPHILFAHDRDDYGHGCPGCHARYLFVRLAKLDVCRHRAWRRWRIVHWLIYRLPVTGYGYEWGNGCRSCLITKSLRWRWSK